MAHRGMPYLAEALGKFRPLENISLEITGIWG